MSTDEVQRVTMPKWGLSMETGKVTEWLVAVGDEIADGQEICEIDTDKIAGVLESTWTGVVRALVVDTETPVPVGGTIAIVAPAAIEQQVIDDAVAQAKEQLASGAIAEEGGPVIAAVDVGGRSISYSMLGDPEAPLTPVLFVHGYGGDKNSWLFVQEPISADRATYALDLPGHGASGKDVGDGSVATLAGVVVGFLAAVGLSRVHLVGHSMGAAVATLAAATAGPGTVASLTLISPAGYGPDINADYLRGFAAAENRRELKPQLQQLFADESLVNRQLIDDLLKYKRLDGVDAALAAIVAGLLDGDRSAVDVTAAQRGFAGPTVVVWGAADRIIPPGNAAALAGHASVHTIDGVGHMAQMENPHAVIAAIREAVGAQ